VECANKDNIAFLALPLECQWERDDDDENDGGGGGGDDDDDDNSSKLVQAVMLLTYLNILARLKFGRDAVCTEYSLNGFPSSLKACAE
jgi:hypothetical protein